ncbi:MAG: hypothetical protein EOM12_07890 [Verrucomicrobiae bacterium]|nr:hypothetical protein [Verrucomicrobiae bacterium]
MKNIFIKAINSLVFTALLFGQRGSSLINIDTNRNKVLVIDPEFTISKTEVSTKFSESFEIFVPDITNQIQISDNYSAYAIPVQHANSATFQKTMQELYKNDATIYLFGDLTIEDYKAALGLSKFGAYTTLNNEDNDIIDPNSFMYFGEDQEKNSIENIVSSSGSMKGRYLLANGISSTDKSKEVNCVEAILEDFVV